MSPLLASLQAAYEALPTALREAGGLGPARRVALDAVLRDGLPTVRAERWKYTSLRAFERRSFGTAAVPVDVQALAGALEAIPAPRLVFVDGAFDDALSLTVGLPDGVDLRPLSTLLAAGEARKVNFLGRRFDAADEAFARLNAALATEGVVLRVADGVRAHAPLHLVFVSTPRTTDLAVHLRSLLEIGRGAEFAVVEHHIAAGPNGHLGNHLVHVHLREGAALSQVRLQDADPRASLFARTDAVLARDARYRRLDLELGAALSRHELNVALQGEGARLVANGVLLADGKRHLDTRLGIDHAAPGTACSLTWRGLGAAQGRAVFHGGILIREGADGTEAELSNKNLLLSADAEIDTQPVLEIHADEVKAAHGATVGQLDPTALFYLRSRGLPLDEARRLLTIAFCREPLAAIEDSALVALLSQHIDRRLHAGGSL